MTRMQEIILLYVMQQYSSGTYIANPIGRYQMHLIDIVSKTECLLSVNLFGDIIDTDSGRIIATSNVQHDIGHIFIMPTHWIHV